MLHKKSFQDYAWCMNIGIKNRKHRILGIHMKNIYARFACSTCKSRNKNLKIRGILHIKSI